METITIDYITSSSDSIPDRVEDFFEHTIAPKLDSYNNLTYLGMASSGAYREAVFQIKDYTNLYLRIIKDERSDWRFCAYPAIRLSTTDDLSTCNSYYTTGIIYGGSPHMEVRNDVNLRVKWFLLSDTNNNLKCMWQFKAPTDAVGTTQGIIFAEDEDDRDVIGIFGSAANPVYILYLDDDDLLSYYIPIDDTAFNTNRKIVKKNWMPICTANNRQSVIGNLKNDFVRIFSTDLQANENAYNKDSYAVRRLIQVGSKKYRQIVSNYWVEDPLGDEIPVIIDNSTYPDPEP